MKVIETMPIGQVQPGMRVAEAVTDAGGRILVPAGAELSDSLLQGLLRRDVDSLRIEREAVDDPHQRAQARAELVHCLDHLFRKAGQGEETRALYQAILDYRLEHRA